MVLSKMSSASFLEYTVTPTLATSLGKLLLAQRSLDHYTSLEKLGRLCGNEVMKALDQ
jgi:hypothetical protein